MKLVFEKELSNYFIMANTRDKEKSGEAVIKQYHLFDVLFPENIGYKKITAKKKQLAGVDFEVYLPDEKEPIYIDLKSCIGSDYSMKTEDYKNGHIVTEREPAIPIELRQYGEFTNSKHKMTDYMLYIVQDDFELRVTLCDYKDIYNLSRHNDKIVVKNAGYEPPDYTEYTSFNRTGTYVKVPATLFKTFTLRKVAN